MTDAPTIWAFDVSKARTGIAFGRAGDKPSFASVESKPSEDFRRVKARLFVKMSDMKKLGAPDAIVAERPLMHGFNAEVDFDARTLKQRKGFKSAIFTASLFYDVGMLAELLSTGYADVAPSTARKEFFGHGALGRDEAKLRARAMCQVLGWEVKNDDEGDAACIWHWGTVQFARNFAAVIHPGMFAKAATIAAERSPAKFARVSDEVPW